MNNCYNCKHCQVASFLIPNRKANYICKKQCNWIYHLEVDCPLFKRSFTSIILGNQSPVKYQLFGGCIK